MQGGRTSCSSHRRRSHRQQHFLLAARAAAAVAAAAATGAARASAAHAGAAYLPCRRARGLRQHQQRLAVLAAARGHRHLLCWCQTRRPPGRAPARPQGRAQTVPGDLQTLLQPVATATCSSHPGARLQQLRLLWVCQAFPSLLLLVCCTGTWQSCAACLGTAPPARSSQPQWGHAGGQKLPQQQAWSAVVQQLLQQRPLHHVAPAPLCGDARGPARQGLRCRCCRC